MLATLVAGMLLLQQRPTGGKDRRRSIIQQALL